MGSVVEVEEDVWHRALEINLKTMMLTSKYAIPKMIEIGSGSIINISSINGLRALATSHTLLPKVVSSP